jgi:hypothetical protein
MVRETYILLMLSLLVTPLGAYSVACSQDNTRRPHHYLIPDRYVGWVKVEFNVKGASPLIFEDGHSVFRIPSSGLFQTSSEKEFGLADDQYFYASGNDKRRLVADTEIISSETMVWSGYSGGSISTNSKEKPLEYIYFFVGPKEEFEKYKCRQARDCLDPDENGNPKVGNKKLSN